MCPKVVIPRLDRGIQKKLDAPIKSEHDSHNKAVFQRNKFLII